MDLKDEAVQTRLSFFAYNVAMLYMTLDAIRSPSEWVEAPAADADPSYATHVWLFLFSVIKLHVWSVIVLYAVVGVLLVAKYMLVDLVLKEGSDLTTSDIHNLLTKYVWQGSSFALRMFAGQTVVAIVFALFVVKPSTMRIESGRLNSLRIFWGTLLGVQLIMFVATLPKRLTPAAASSESDSSD